MTGKEPRKAEVERWRREIVDLLGDFPRQHAALGSAMAAFGEDFDLKRFRAAYETESDMEAYNRAQAVERALGRVQNYTADLAIAGVKLAGLEPAEHAGGSAAQRAFEALRAARVIDGELCRRLLHTQKARSAIEHSYVNVPAGTVHRAALMVHESARDFMGPYRRWIEPLL